MHARGRDDVRSNGGSIKVVVWFALEVHLLDLEVHWKIFESFSRGLSPQKPAVVYPKDSHWIGHFLRMSSPLLQLVGAIPIRVRVCVLVFMCVCVAYTRPLPERLLTRP